MKTPYILLGFAGGIVLSKLFFGLGPVQEHISQPLFETFNRFSDSVTVEVDEDGFQ